jgi:hypothetical protein
MRATARIALLSATVSGLLVLGVSGALPASAAPLPETVLKMKSIDWQPRTGDVEVTSRVKCIGKGTFSWQVSLQQKKARDRGSAQVPCDGDGFLSTIVLNAKQARFHPGPADFSRGSITCGADTCIGFQILQPIRIRPTMTALPS